MFWDHNIFCIDILTLTWSFGTYCPLVIRCLMVFPLTIQSSPISCFLCFFHFSSPPPPPPHFPAPLFLLIITQRQKRVSSSSSTSSSSSPLLLPSLSSRPCSEIKDYRQTSHYFHWWQPYITATAPKRGGERKRDRGWVGLDWNRMKSGISWKPLSLFFYLFSLPSQCAVFSRGTRLCEINGCCTAVCTESQHGISNPRSIDTQRDLLIVYCS